MDFDFILDIIADVAKVSYYVVYIWQFVASKIRKEK